MCMRVCMHVYTSYHLCQMLISYRIGHLDIWIYTIGHLEENIFVQTL